jgi:hypothetical protein
MRDEAKALPPRGAEEALSTKNNDYKYLSWLWGWFSEAGRLEKVCTVHFKVDTVFTEK